MSEFRKAIAEAPSVPTVQSVPQELKATSTEHAPELVATYAEDMGNPYVAKLLGLESVWDKEPTMAREIKELEGYIQEQVRIGKLDNSTRATDRYFKDMERKAGLTGYESATKRISSLLAYIDFRRVVDE